LYRAFLRNQETNIKKLNIDLLIHLYIKNILHIDDEYLEKITKVIEQVADTFQEIIIQWIELDDNKEYLRIAMENWMNFTGNKTLDEITKRCSTEDFIRFT
jgi:hypothetical protein